MFETNFVEKIKTNFMFNNFFPENCAVYEIVWENTVQPDRPQMKIWRTRIACWISKTTNTHSEFNKITYSFSTAMLRYTG